MRSERISCDFNKPEVGNLCEWQGNRLLQFQTILLFELGSAITDRRSVQLPNNKLVYQIESIKFELFTAHYTIVKCKYKEYILPVSNKGAVSSNVEMVN